MHFIILIIFRKVFTIRCFVANALNSFNYLFSGSVDSYSICSKTQIYSYPSHFQPDYDDNDENVTHNSNTNHNNSNNNNNNHNHTNNNHSNNNTSNNSSKLKSFFRSKSKESDRKKHGKCECQHSHHTMISSNL